MRIKGVKVKIPSNYNPLTRVYTGTWDGTFTVAWSDNPAWIFYDLVTNDRYGLGEVISESMVDKWGLYEIAKYCDELVDNGFGGLEPRFTCNMYLQTREQAFKLSLI
jgi:predicted phage tail protein